MSLPAPVTLPGLVAARLLDAPLAALAWLLVDRGVPALVAGREPGPRDALVEALVAALPPHRRPGGAAPGHPNGGPGVGTESLVRVAATLGPGSPPGLLRAALGATTGRSGLVATVEAGDLAGVLAALAREGLGDDEASFLGVVLVAEARPEVAGAARIVVAHYLRPLLRDAGGHERRQRPAVLAAWIPGDDRWEDFSWGIAPDLAQRGRMRAGDFEAERMRRAEAIDGLVARGRLDPGALGAAARRLPLDPPVTRGPA
ncbi:MAG: hypothetical protein M0T75_02020 [Chloroflexi bacterium]|nr:hypothetical protein [Chloroflexota bacterium]